MRLDLPFPNKLLWPNGSRGSIKAVAGQKKRHKEWALWAAKAADKPQLGEGLVPIRLIVHAKPYGPLPDRDNCVSALKVYQDAIASVIGVNDRDFAVPTVEFSPFRTSRFVIEVGHG